MHLAKMICASVPMMEDNPVLRNDISDFVYESYNHIEEEAKLRDAEKLNDYLNAASKRLAELSPDLAPKILDRQGNVVYLSFNTKTKGSA
jgi:phosphoribosyl 1,2-cyclic phosphodiesterase